jgi:prepilin-type N-terminal cleavage/methylation domain-containing protein
MPGSRPNSPRPAQAGFTLVELMIALAIFGMLATAIYGVVVLGAQSAGSGERITEQARRFRVATEIIVRQLRSVAADKVMQEDGYQQLFLGEEDHIEFITSIPQRSAVSGLGIVRYWIDEGVVRISEVPLFIGGAQEDRGFDEDEFAMVTDLLFDVQSLTFGYRRTSEHTEEWASEWIAAEEGEFPSAVRIQIEPSTPDGPKWYHEIPIMIGAFSEITGQEESTGLGRTGGRRPQRPERVPEPEPEESTTSTTIDDGD